MGLVLIITIPQEGAEDSCHWKGRSNHRLARVASCGMHSILPLPEDKNSSVKRGEAGLEGPASGIHIRAAQTFHNFMLCAELRARRPQREKPSS